MVNFLFKSYRIFVKYIEIYILLYVKMMNSRFNYCSKYFIDSF